MIAHVDVPEALVEVIAERAAAIVLERLGSTPAGREFLDVDEAAEFLRCKPQRIYDLRSSGRLSRYADGSRALIARSELVALVSDDARAIATVLPPVRRNGSGSGAAG